MMTFHGKHALLCVLFFLVWMLNEQLSHEVPNTDVILKTSLHT